MVWSLLLDLGFEDPWSHALEAQEAYSGVDVPEPKLVYQNDIGQVVSPYSPLSVPFAPTAA